MIKPGTNILRLLWFLLFFTLSLSPNLEAETTLLKNATVYLPNSTYQPDAFIIIDGCKIKETGRMKHLKEGIFDNIFELKGAFVYPAFIDTLYKGFLPVEAKKEKKEGTGERPPVDKTKREPMEKRNYRISVKAVEKLQLKKETAKQLMARGFAFAHVVPQGGIMSGTTCVVSLVSDDPGEAVLVPDVYMPLAFKSNRGAYPTTYASLAAELRQLKEDCLYYEKKKTAMFFHPTRRWKYKPELDILLPYFQNKKRFLMALKNTVEQRITEIISRELNLDPVLLANTDSWRRKIDAGADIILPLSFDAPPRSKYAQMGDTIKKEWKEKHYPEKLAQFLKSHKFLCLAAPKTGDYKRLFENIRILKKNGVEESEIIKALTVNPARLLGISKLAGTIEPGKLASLFVADKKVFEEKSKIKKMFVEGRLFEFKEDKKKEKPAKKKEGGPQ